MGSDGRAGAMGGVEMNIGEWSTDKIIGAGLILVALSAVAGSIIVTIMTGADSALETCAKEIAIGLAGYMGRGGVEKFVKATKEDKPEEKEALPNDQCIR